MNSVGIIGFGRFGKVLAHILQKGFEVNIYDLNHNESFGKVNFVTSKKLIKEKTIFVSVPIREFKKVIKDISLKVNEGTTIIDVCSVKKYPIDIVKQYLPLNIGFIATHPMFGPDSYEVNKNLKMVMHKSRDANLCYNFWKTYFRDQNIQIIEMEPEEHDLLAAQTQGLTHFLGRMLDEYGINKTKIDTQGFRDLLDLVDQTCNDSWELYSDLQQYNPYTKNMILKLKKSVNHLEKQLEETNSNEMEIK